MNEQITAQDENYRAMLLTRRLPGDLFTDQWGNRFLVDRDTNRAVPYKPVKDSFGNLQTPKGWWL